MMIYIKLQQLRLLLLHICSSQFHSMKGAEVAISTGAKFQKAMI